MGILLDDPNAQPNETGDGYYDSFYSSTVGSLVASGTILSDQVDLTSSLQLSQITGPINNFAIFPDISPINVPVSNYSASIGGANIGKVTFSGGVESKKTRYELLINI